MIDQKRHFIVPEVTANSISKCIQNLIVSKKSDECTRRYNDRYPTRLSFYKRLFSCLLNSSVQNQ